MKSFKTKTYTLMSILAVLVFLVYIMGFVFMQSVPFRTAKASDVEVVKIIKRKAPGVWTILLSFKSGGEEVMAALDIQEGEIVSGVEDNASQDAEDQEILKVSQVLEEKPNRFECGSGGKT